MDEDAFANLDLDALAAAAAGDNEAPPAPERTEAEKQDAAAYDERGRGIQILHTQTDAWDYAPLANGRGKSIWFIRSMADSDPDPGTDPGTDPAEPTDPTAPQGDTPATPEADTDEVAPEPATGDQAVDPSDPSTSTLTETSAMVEGPESLDGPVNQPKAPGFGLGGIVGAVGGAIGDAMKPSGLLAGGFRGFGAVLPPTDFDAAPDFADADNLIPLTWDISEADSLFDLEVALQEHHPDVMVLPFLDPDLDIDLDRAREFVQAVHEMLTEHPEIDLRQVAISWRDEDLDAPFAVEPGLDQQVFTKRITLRRKYAKGPKLPPGEVYWATVFAFGQAMVYAGRWRAEAHAMDALRHRHTNDYRGTVPFGEWLHEQFGAALFDQRDGSLELAAALADSFEAVKREAAEGTAATDGQRALFELLQREAAAWHRRTPYDASAPVDPAFAEQRRAALAQATAFTAETDVCAPSAAIPDVGIDTFREYLQTVHDELRANPALDVVALDIAPLGDHVLAHTHFVGPEVPGMRPTAVVLVLNERYAINPGLLRRRVERNVAHRFSVGSADSPVRTVITHELGHAMHAAGGRTASVEALNADWEQAWDDLEAACREQLVRKVGPDILYGPDFPTLFRLWLRVELTGYCFRADGSLSIYETYAEAYAAVRLDPVTATVAQRILYRRLLELDWQPGMGPQPDSDIQSTTNIVAAESGSTLSSEAVARSYLSPDDVHRAEFERKVFETDLSSPEAVAEALYERVGRDAVTEFYDARVSGLKTAEVLRAQNFAAYTGVPAFFVSADVANLSGLNAFCNNQAETANVYYHGIATAFRTALEDSGGVVIPMRTGGDEVGAIVLGIDEQTLTEIIAEVNRRVTAYARQEGLSEIEHPKHPGDPAYRGVGLHVGFTEIVPGLTPKDIFDDADLGVDASKNGRTDVAGDPRRATGADRADTGTAGATDPGTGTRAGGEASSGQSETARGPETPPRGLALGGLNRNLPALAAYPSPDELRRFAFAEGLRALGELTPELVAEAMYRPVGRDEVTDFYDARLSGVKTAEVVRAQQFVAETGVPAFFLSADIANLSGLNALMNNRAEAANVHFRGIAEAFRYALDAVGGAVVPMRTGGDELAAVVIGIDQQTLTGVLADIQARVAAYTAEHGLDVIEHPKHPGEAAYRGMGLHVGVTDILPGLTPKDIFDDADLGVDASKNRAYESADAQVNQDGVVDGLRQAPGSLIGQLLPELSTYEIVGDDPTATLLPGEAAVLLKETSTPFWVREKANTRTAARRALAERGHGEVEIPRGPLGEPVFPEGLVGSLTNKMINRVTQLNYYAAVVADTEQFRAVGIDAEDNRSIRELMYGTGRVEELLWVQEQLDCLPDSGVAWDKVLFSVKESIFKAWYTATGDQSLRLNHVFHDSLVTFDIEAGTFHVQLMVKATGRDGLPLTEMHGRFVVRGNAILTAALVPNTAEATLEPATAEPAVDPSPARAAYAEAAYALKWLLMARGYNAHGIVELAPPLGVNQIVATTLTDWGQTHPQALAADAELRTLWQAFQLMLPRGEHAQILMPVRVPNQGDHAGVLELTLHEHLLWDAHGAPFDQASDADRLAEIVAPQRLRALAALMPNPESARILHAVAEVLTNHPAAANAPTTLAPVADHTVFYHKNLATGTGKVAPISLDLSRTTAAPHRTGDSALDWNAAHAAGIGGAIGATAAPKPAGSGTPAAVDWDAAHSAGVGGAIGATAAPNLTGANMAQAAKGLRGWNGAVHDPRPAAQPTKNAALQLHRRLQGAFAQFSGRPATCLEGAALATATQAELNDGFRRLDAHQRELLLRFRSQPSLPEVAAAAGVDPGQVRRAVVRFAESIAATGHPALEAVWADRRADPELFADAAVVVAAQQKGGGAWRRALGTLTEQQRTCLDLTLQGLRPAAIAVDLSVDAAAVQVLRAEAIRQMVEALAQPAAVVWMSPDEALLALEKMQRDDPAGVRSAVQSLDTQGAKIIRRRIMQGMTSADTAADLGISEDRLAEREVLAVGRMVKKLSGAIVVTGADATVVAAWQADDENFLDCMDLLTPQQRTAVVMFLEGWSRTEIAAALDISPQATSKVRTRAIAKLVELLATDPDARIPAQTRDSAELRRVRDLAADPDALRQAARHLSEADWTLIEQRFILKEKTAHIAAALALPEHVIEQRQYRAVLRLNRKLDVAAVVAAVLPAVTDAGPLSDGVHGFSEPDTVAPQLVPAEADDLPIADCVDRSLARVAADQGDVAGLPDPETRSPSGRRWRDVRGLLRGARPEGFDTAGPHEAHANLVEGLIHQARPGAMAWVFDQRHTADQQTGIGAHAYTVKYLGDNVFEVDGQRVTYEGKPDDDGLAWFRTAAGDRVSLAELTGGSLAETAATRAVVWRNGQVVQNVGDRTAPLPEDNLLIGATVSDQAGAQPDPDDPFADEPRTTRIELAAQPPDPLLGPTVFGLPGDATHPVWELLFRTAIGQEAMAVLHNAEAHVQFGDRDHFHGRIRRITIDTTGRGLIAVAEQVLAHAARMQAVAADAVETEPMLIRDMDQDAFVEPWLRAEATAIAWRAEFDQQVQAAGFARTDLLGVDRTDLAFQQALFARYFAAYDSAQVAPGTDDALASRARRVAGVDALLESAEFITATDLRETLESQWESRQGMSRGLELTERQVRERQRLMRIDAALQREIDALETAWDQVQDQVRAMTASKVAAMPDTTDRVTRLHYVLDVMSDHFLRSEVRMWPTHSREQMGALVELTELWQRAHARAAAVGRAMDDINGRPRREAAVPRDLEIADRAVLPSLERTANREMASVRAELQSTETGRWAMRTLERLGVRIRFGFDQIGTIDAGRENFTRESGYDAVTNTLVLPFGRGSVSNAEQLVVAAHLAQATRSGADPMALLTEGRDNYVTATLDLRAEAEARRFHHRREMHGYSRYTGGPLVKAYYAAYDRAESLLRNAYSVESKYDGLRNDNQVPRAAMHAVAYRFAARTVREQLAALGPVVDGVDLETFIRSEWDRAHAIPPTANTPAPETVAPAELTDAMLDLYAARFVEAIRELFIQRAQGAFVPLGPAEQAYMAAEDTAQQLAAVRAYLAETGLVDAQIALDLARFASEDLNRRLPWDIEEDSAAQPALDALEAAIEAATASEPETPGLDSGVFGLELDRVLAENPGAQRVVDEGPLADRLALLPPHPGSDKPRLLVLAEPGEHVDLLRDLELEQPDFDGVLWRGSHELEYLSVTLGSDGEVVVADMLKDDAEGMFRAARYDEVAPLLLDHYLRYRLRSEVDPDFTFDLDIRQWLELLGPDAFIAAGTAHAEVTHGFEHVGFRMVQADPSITEPHPAAISHRMVTRQIPLPIRDFSDRPAGKSVDTNLPIGVVSFTLRLHADGAGGWRVAPPNHAGHPTDVLSRWFQGMSGTSPDEVAERIAQLLLDGSARIAPLVPAALVELHTPKPEIDSTPTAAVEPQAEIEGRSAEPESPAAKRSFLRRFAERIRRPGAPATGPEPSGQVPGPRAASDTSDGGTGFALPEAGAPLPNPRPAEDCVRQTMRTGRAAGLDVTVPTEAKLSGRTALEVEEQYAHGRMRPADSRDAIAARLTDPDDPATAMLMVEEYSIGGMNVAHLTLWRLVDGQVMVSDPNVDDGAWREHVPGTVTPGSRKISAIAYGAKGKALLPSTEHAADTEAHPDALITHRDLTPREVEVLDLVAAGLTNKQIAERLTLADYTVHTHLNSIAIKLGTGDRAAMAAIGVRSGILPFSDPLVDMKLEGGLHPDALDDIQLEVLALVADGWSNKEVGLALDTTESVVKNHLVRIGRALGISARAGIVATALRAGILPMDAEFALRPQSGEGRTALSPRETEVYTLRTAGRSNTEIAAALEISEHTVATYLARIAHKLGVGEVAGLVAGAETITAIPTPGTPTPPRSVTPAVPHEPTMIDTSRAVTEPLDQAPTMIGIERPRSTESEVSTNQHMSGASAEASESSLGGQNPVTPTQIVPTTEGPEYLGDDPSLPEAHVPVQEGEGPEYLGEDPSLPEAVVPGREVEGAEYLDGQAETDGPEYLEPAQPRTSALPGGYSEIIEGIGNFDGNGRMVDDGVLTPQLARQAIANMLRAIMPVETGWHRDGHFLLPDGRQVHVRVESSFESEVGSFQLRPGGAAFDIILSDQLRTRDVPRAVAHMLTRIRQLTDPEFQHPGPRFAELKVLATQLDQSIFDPARSKLTPEIRADFDDLIAHLGMDADPVGPAAAALAAHDPELSRRIGLEYGGAVAFRPVFGKTLTDPAFQEAALTHLGQLARFLTGEHASEVLMAEGLSLNARMREEQCRRLFEPIFANRDVSTIRKQLEAAKLFTGDDLVAALAPIKRAFNDPMPPEWRRSALEAAITEVQNTPGYMQQINRFIDFERMRQAARAYTQMPDRVGGLLDRTTGQVQFPILATNPHGATMSMLDFFHAMDRANRGAEVAGLDIEYVVVIHDEANGRSSVDVLSRPRAQYRLPAQQSHPVRFVPRPSVPAAVEGGHTVDVGVGRGGFAVELTPAQDTSGRGLVLQTELPMDYADAGQRRRNLGILDAGPLTRPGSLMVWADFLLHGAVLNAGGNGGVARYYINNVSAHYGDADYDALAQQLPHTLVPGAHIEIQWDMKSELVEGGEPGDRGHIQGDKLMLAISRVLRPSVAAAFEMIEHTEFEGDGSDEYLFTIDTGASNVIDPDAMARYSPPQPTDRMVIVYKPAGYRPATASLEGGAR
ncbi:LuxR C-terminal-related transcriptional regulator [Nocardia lijiangensis]|uniref:LuxR C-terminal-related transcriptional regulator n=1 Tax=Nocardia lijiangensis TaxID=299618 RepID=UPI0008367874|nr:LuxR C-terminal-related transcriptional regulator [Nocardia lijiangensis]